jgi:hypothetical protein
MKNFLKYYKHDDRLNLKIMAHNSEVVKDYSDIICTEINK